MLGKLMNLLGEPAKIGDGEKKCEGEPVYRELASAEAGLLPGMPAELAEEERRLEEALPEEWLLQVRETVLRGNPELTEEKYSWMERELKRHFLLIGLLRRVSLYSAEAGLIWRELALFEQEYQQFCERYAGYYMQVQAAVPAPSPSPSADSAERACFELLYMLLFPVEAENELLLGPFNLHTLSPQLLEELHDRGQPLCGELGFAETSHESRAAVAESLTSSLRDRLEAARECSAARRLPEPHASDPATVLLTRSLAGEGFPFDADEQLDAPKAEHGRLGAARASQKGPRP
ncbi:MULTISPECIES: hypothetical protein [unclassified Paenibacillus]|uniref:hypothetical protein n=1 Tax=unclassified Paenibacillus TaxID=185978 RepID=UPI000953F511|nr:MULTISPECIES: hypothetical protein [unclassified Paenibacillus]ASS68086.1 hypothetical protein CIC07_19585 [Paenibacillus sp. RUD330]SIR39385.1 hypothetical protein SAMN05880555_3632 [Paenibacillus sp. RU4X]SIR49841.1 hypothetical protein SAMN05880570_3633 [Paenibacillus sp. RU4T]